MNIEYLKYFAELAKTQHYGQAAKALNISQPGLSHAIKTLEEEYGVPLFQKEGRNVSLSQYGKELMTEVEEILDAYLRMEERAAGFRAEEKTVRIGTVYPLAPGMIPRMLRQFGATFPFIIYNRLTPEIEEGLLDGSYDIGFCSDLLKSDGLEYYPIRESYIAVAVPKGHPLEARESITLKEAAGYVFKDQWLSRTAGADFCRRRDQSQAGVLSGRNGSGDRARGKWIRNFRAALYGYDTASQYNSHTGSDIELEIQILYCTEKIWHSIEAGGCIFSVLENVNYSAPVNFFA